MKSFALYGAQAMSLADIAHKVEKALGTNLTLHHSSFCNGDYYLFESPDFTRKIVSNELDEEGEQIEEGFSQYSTLVHLDGFTCRNVPWLRMGEGPPRSPLLNKLGRAVVSSGANGFVLLNGAFDDS